LTFAKDSLEKDFKQEDIEENMGDVDFANDFMEMLMDLENELKTACE
jgi:hypothetical protein